MLSYELAQEIKQYEREVDAESARLIRLGVPPWDAVIQARQRVSERRRLAEREKGQ